MANDITNVMYRILSGALPILRRTAWAPQVCNRDYQAEVAQQGDTIDATVYPESTPYQISPSHNPLAPQDTTPTKVSLVLDQWYGDNFHLTDKQLAEIATRANFIPRVIETKIEGLAKMVNTSVLQEYVNSYGFVGTPGTTPFSNANDRTAAKDGSKVSAKLTQQRTPTGNRFCLLNEDATAEALVLPQFAHAEKRGNNNAVEDATVGNQYGITWLHEDNTLTHTAGTASGVQTSAAGSIGDKSITCDTGTGTMVVGDIITFAGHDQTYVVTSAVADVSSGTVNFEPALQAAVADNAAITVKGDHKVNLAMHRDAVVLGSRLLTRDTGNETAVLPDPVTGLVLRLERVRQRKQTMWELDAMWGVETFRREYMVRLAG